MDNSKIKEAIEKIANEIKLVVKMVLDGYSLGDSKLYQDMQVTVEDIDMIKVTVNDYIKWIQGGREVGSGKRGGFPDYPDLKVIAAWCASKGIPSDNDAVLRISWGIYWHGIQNAVEARPIFEKYEGGWESGEDSPVAEEIDKYWNEWSEMLFEAITSDLDEDFKS